MNEMKKTFFNIIVVSYNAGDKLIDTIESIRRQTFTEYRILVKDGMSTDGSIEKLKSKYEVGKDLILVESCDSGIYHAMNIAASYLEEKIISMRAIDQDAENIDEVKLLRAGEEPAYIFFLNCGDTFRDENVLRDVHDAIIERNSKEGTTLPAMYAIDGIMAFSTIPLSFASFTGLFFCLFSFVFIIFTIWRKLAFGDETNGWPSLVCIISLISGIQMQVLFGALLGTLIGYLMAI